MIHQYLFMYMTFGVVLYLLRNTPETKKFKANLRKKAASVSKQ